MRKLRKRAWTVWTLVALAGLGAARSPGGGTADGAREPWDPETVRLFGGLPVQDGGRVKPLETLARFRLLEIQGSTRVVTPDGERLGPGEWLLDCWFFPERARTYACILVEDPADRTALGLEERVGDRYSYEELLPRLLEAKARSMPDGGTDLPGKSSEALGKKVHAFQRLVECLDFARDGAPPATAGIAILPPADPAQETWDDPATLSGTLASDQAEVVALLHRLVASRAERATLRSELASLSTRVRAMAEARGEYAKIPLELAFHRLAPFARAPGLFLLGLLLAGASALAPRVRGLRWAAWGAVTGGLLLVGAGIALRCLIRARPPVTSLYETALFLTASCVVACLVLEARSRQRLALALAPLLGAAGLLLASWCEQRDAITSGDTLPSLVAVLDANAWLTAHVTTVVLGYAGGLLAAILAHVWLLGPHLGLRRGDGAFYGSVARAIHGLLVFGLVFTALGTLLGGLWANESWGRFWGWDPKENAALMICLWELVLLQARQGGFLRERGLAAGAVVLGGVVVFSWWGVNLLGQGLHSFGDIPGVRSALMVFACVEALVLGLAALAWLRARGVREPAKPHLGSAPS